MEKGELITHCKYYKGETKSPYNDLLKKVFWKCERVYVESASSSNYFHNMYKKEVEEYIQKHKDENSSLTSEETSIEAKAIRIFIKDMFKNWRPKEAEELLCQY
ncbi:MAG: hypothetical protein M0P12_11900 [Paludibacteraceae bacterium]|nr:hypothetical protein [Paludibacteraceae bacterium]